MLNNLIKKLPKIKDFRKDKGKRQIEQFNQLVLIQDNKSRTIRII
jgi:hypothetical protein